MGTREANRHPIDYEVHPVGGWFVAVWGLLMCIGPGIRGPGEGALRFAVEMLMGVGIMLLGVAMVLPKGGTRRLVVGAWGGSIVAWLVLMVYGFVV